MVSKVHNLEEAGWLYITLEQNVPFLVTTLRKQKPFMGSCFTEKSPFPRLIKISHCDGKNYTTSTGGICKPLSKPFKSFRALIYISQGKLCQQCYSFREGRATRSAQWQRASEQSEVLFPNSFPNSFATMSAFNLSSHRITSNDLIYSCKRCEEGLKCL